MQKEPFLHENNEEKLVSLKPGCRFLSHFGRNMATWRRNIFLRRGALTRGMFQKVNIVERWNHYLRAHGRREWFFVDIFWSWACWESTV